MRDQVTNIILFQVTYDVRTDMARAYLDTGGAAASTLNQASCCHRMHAQASESMRLPSPFRIMKFCLKAERAYSKLCTLFHQRTQVGGNTATKQLQFLLSAWMLQSICQMKALKQCCYTTL